MSWLLERLRKIKDSRGMMANLRCVLADNKKHRAWPALYRLGVEINNENAAYIAGLFATHPLETSAGNLGDTCKKIEQYKGEKRGDDRKPTPTERRFQHLLAAEQRKELHDRVLRMVLMAKAAGIPVNYESLEVDLRKPDDWRKRDWAITFWAQGAPSVAEEEA